MNTVYCVFCRNSTGTLNLDKVFTSKEQANKYAKDKNHFYNSVSLYSIEEWTLE